MFNFAECFANWERGNVTQNKERTFLVIGKGAGVGWEQPRARDAAGAWQSSRGENEAPNSLRCSGKRGKEIEWQQWGRTARTADFRGS